MKALWNDQVIAESNETVVVESNHYFPESSVNQDFLRPSETPRFLELQAAYDADIARMRRNVLEQLANLERESKGDST